MVGNAPHHAPSAKKSKAWSTFWYQMNNPFTEHLGQVVLPCRKWKGGRERIWPTKVSSKASFSLSPESEVFTALLLKRASWSLSWKNKISQESQCFLRDLLMLLAAKISCSPHSILAELPMPPDLCPFISYSQVVFLFLPDLKALPLTSVYLLKLGVIPK